ncbi:MAG TPA: hypothetical protein VG961_00060 [Ignavibacteria bacterium]|nr:hypothetical protein [Ignavibacteria bacterium]
MSNNEKFQKNFEYYRKYVICIILNKKKYFTLWGADNEDRENDKFILNKFGKIALFKNVTELLDLIKSNEIVLFDKSRTRRWMKKSKDILNKRLIDSISNEYVFSLDQFLKIIPTKKSNIVKLSPLKYNLFIDVVNIIDDYEFQIGNKSLLKLRRNKNVNLFWEYCYDRVLWGVKEEDKPKINRFLLSKIKITDLRKKVLEIHNMFTNNIHIMN